MNEKSIDELAKLLESAGYTGALLLINNELIPLAKEKHISLYEAALKYADPDEQQDTSWHQLHLALLKLDPQEVEKLDIKTDL